MDYVDELRRLSAYPGLGVRLRSSEREIIRCAANEIEDLRRERSPIRERSTDEKITLLSERISLLEARGDPARSLNNQEARIARLESWCQAIGSALNNLKAPD